MISARILAILAFCGLAAATDRSARELGSSGGKQRDSRTEDKFSLSIAKASAKLVELDCKKLLAGQYLCDEPDMDSYTQQIKGCRSVTATEEWKASINCTAVPGIVCKETGNSSFTKDEPCK